MQIFVKTLTGKTITMEVEIPETPRTVEHIIYLNYTSKSHVLTGKPSDALREEIKSLKLATYHPRLYPQGDASSLPEKGWLVKRERLDEIKELLKKHNISPKIVPAGIRPNSTERNTDVVVAEIRMALAAMGEPDEPEKSDASESSSDFDESLVNQVSKEEKAKIIEEIKECLVTPDESPKAEKSIAFPPENFKGIILPSGIGYGAKKNGTSTADLHVCSHPGEHKGFAITHVINNQITLFRRSSGDFFTIYYGKNMTNPRDLRSFLVNYYNEADADDQTRFTNLMTLFVLMNGGDDNKKFAKLQPELWGELENWAQ